MKTRQKLPTLQKSSTNLSIPIPYLRSVLGVKVLILEQALSSIFYPELWLIVSSRNSLLGLK